MPKVCRGLEKRKRRKKVIDLHLHTTASDGSLSPSELVKMAVERGMEAISITDHDTIDGLAEGRKKAEELGIKFINGMELSSEWDGREVHILGYFFDTESEMLKKELAKMKEARDNRNVKILEKLRRYKMDISHDELKEEAGGDIVSRAHIANLILKKGYVYSKGEIFKRYLGIGGLAYVPKGDLTPERAVEIIIEAGGIASLAHPKYISEDEMKLTKIINTLKDAGLKAMEVYYSNFTLKEVIKYKRIALKNGLLLTGGSDYHGGNKGNIEIGDGAVPLEVCSRMEDLILENRS